MKVDLNKLFETEGETFVVEGHVDLSEVRVWGNMPFHRAVPVKLEASNRAGVVTLNLSCTFALELECDRCLESFTRTFELSTRHTAVKELFGKDDDQFLVLPDGILDVDELATTDIVLELPYGKLCRPDCKGLCPQCGCDLNQNSCSCKAETDPRLAALDRFQF